MKRILLAGTFVAGFASLSIAGPPPPMLVPPSPAYTRGVPPINVHNCPKAHPIKGNIQGKNRVFYHPGDPAYGSIRPERCFANDAEARAEGFHGHRPR